MRLSPNDRQKALKPQLSTAPSRLDPLFACAETSVPFLLYFCREGTLFVPAAARPQCGRKVRFKLDARRLKNQFVPGSCAYGASPAIWRACEAGFWRRIEGWGIIGRNAKSGGCSAHCPRRMRVTAMQMCLYVFHDLVRWYWYELL